MRFPTGAHSCWGTLGVGWILLQNVIQLSDEEAGVLSTNCQSVVGRGLVLSGGNNSWVLPLPPLGDRKMPRGQEPRSSQSASCHVLTWLLRAHGWDRAESATHTFHLGRCGREKISLHAGRWWSKGVGVGKHQIPVGREWELVNPSLNEAGSVKEQMEGDLFVWTHWILSGKFSLFQLCRFGDTNFNLVCNKERGEQRQASSCAICLLRVSRTRS